MKVFLYWHLHPNSRKITAEQIDSETLWATWISSPTYLIVTNEQKIDTEEMHQILLNNKYQIVLSDSFCIDFLIEACSSKSVRSASFSSLFQNE